MNDNPRVAHGFEFHPSDEIFGLRSGSGRPIEIVTGRVPDAQGTLVGEWTEIPGKRTPTTVSTLTHGTFLVVVGSMARFLVEPGRITAEFRPNLPAPLRSKLLMSTPVALLLYSAGTLGLHAGAVEVGGRAILIAATGGSGKTTLTTAFHLAGHRLLGDDLAAVGSEATVFPAQALVRVRPQTAEWLRTKLSNTTPLWSADGHEFHEIALDRRGSGDPVPVAAIVILGWSENGPQLTTIPPAIAIQALWDKTFYLADGTGAAVTLDRLGDLVDAVPAYRLDRPRDLDQLDATVSLLASELLPGSSP